MFFFRGVGGGRGRGRERGFVTHLIHITRVCVCPRGKSEGKIKEGRLGGLRSQRSGVWNVMGMGWVRSGDEGERLEN